MQKISLLCFLFLYNKFLLLKHCPVILCNFNQCWCNSDDSINSVFSSFFLQCTSVFFLKRCGFLNPPPKHLNTLADSADALSSPFTGNAASNFSRPSLLLQTVCSCPEVARHPSLLFQLIAANTIVVDCLFLVDKLELFFSIKVCVYVVCVSWFSREGEKYVEL